MSGLSSADRFSDEAWRVKTAWAQAAGAQTSEDGKTWSLRGDQAWPSDFVLAFLVRCLRLDVILEELRETTYLRSWEGSPRDLGAFYHRCYDRMIDWEARFHQQVVDAAQSAVTEASEPAG